MHAPVFPYFYTQPPSESPYRHLNINRQHFSLRVYCVRSPITPAATHLSDCGTNVAKRNGISKTHPYEIAYPSFGLPAIRFMQAWQVQHSITENGAILSQGTWEPASFHPSLQTTSRCSTTQPAAEICGAQVSARYRLLAATVRLQELFAQDIAGDNSKILTNNTLTETPCSRKCNTLTINMLRANSASC